MNEAASLNAPAGPVMPAFGKSPGEGGRSPEDSRHGVASVAVASADGDGREGNSAEPVSGRRRPEVTSGNPTVTQRELGVRLRELRRALNLTVDEVAAQLLCSATKISRLETGTRRASLRDVRDLSRIYGVTDQAEAEYLMNLARQARQRGWWAHYEDLKLDPYIGLEQEAVAITSFSMYYVPSLLQTEAYARAIIKGIAPAMEPRILDQRVEARMRRKELLDRRPPPRYRALLDEAVLRRHVGGLAVMRAQLDNVLQRAAEDKATVQVIPFDIGEYGSVDSNFDLLEFGPDSPQRPVVFVEGLFNNLYQEKPAEIERYRESVENIRDAALSPRDSVALIAEIRTTYANQTE